ncbi:aspartate aminotransferase family protein [Rhodoligotrophos defluvii]|uniref:aspartate aminotransferase family protein n=1 Tax=Rhodoligotrophos defluvii TaxID=2561934 RepID=UPI0010C9F30D|nr:aspartate aminotransferase family protein [Rhodoligotrophos defluvii]
MLTSSLRNLGLDQALDQAERRYRGRNPKSAARHEAASRTMPGGNTRTVLHYTPFPVAIVKGEGATLTDLDGHTYTDFLSEYTAGLYGHSNEIIASAVRAALANGVVLGGPNQYEAELARLLCERFPSCEKVRFCNSGTEANVNAIGLARAVTGRTDVMIFANAYHGGVLTFSGGGSPMNVPFPFITATYNDIEGTRRLLQDNGERLAAVILEPMMGSGGAIAAKTEFLQMLREETEALGIALIFDEVMTSRLSAGGLQAKTGVIPDLTTFGKYVGGGLTFGAFGGRERFMERLNPFRSDGLTHSGTYNNNVLTMAAGVAGLSKVYTPEVAEAFTARGERLKSALNQVAQRRGLPIQVTGVGTIMCVHFTDKEIRSPQDIPPVDPRLRALFHLEMLERGFYMARRGFISLSLPLTDADYDRFAEAFDDVITLVQPHLPA